MGYSILGLMYAIGKQEMTCRLKLHLKIYVVQITEVLDQTLLNSARHRIATVVRNYLTLVYPFMVF